MDSVEIGRASDDHERGRIAEVLGRGSDGSRGRAPVDHLVLEREDGSTTTVQRVRPDGAQVGAFPLAAPPQSTNFGKCPICQGSENLTRVHVPQADLGGTVMTRTCAECNNGLGSTVEPELRDWFDDAVSRVWLSGGTSPSWLTSPRLLIRETTEGRLVLLPDVSKKTLDLGTLLANGSAQVQPDPPDRMLWSLAALKHAYLGACLCRGYIPDTPLARQVRADLIAARDARRNGVAEVSKFAWGLRISRSYRAAKEPTVLLVQLRDENGVPADAGLSLAGTLFVSWPLELDLLNECIDPALRRSDDP